MREFIILATLALFACGAPVEAPIDLGQASQPFRGAKVVNGGGTSLGTSGWLASGWTPTKCRHNSTDYCLIPETKAVCIYGHTSMPYSSTIGRWIDEMYNAVDLDGDDEGFYTLTGSSSGVCWPEYPDEVHMQSAQWDPSNWSNWTNVAMTRVVRVGCGDYGAVQSESYAATWQKCHKYGLEVDTARLNAWISNHGLNAAAVYRRVYGYGLSVTRGIGRGTRPGFTYHVLTPGTAQSYDYLDAVDRLLADAYDPDQNGNALTLSTVQVGF